MSKPQATLTPEELYNEATEGKDLSFGALRLLTSGLLALRKAHEKPLNNIERQAVYSMIAYVAYTQDVRENMVCEVLTSHFRVNTIAELPSRIYQEAIEYLVDLKMDKVIN